MTKPSYPTDMRAAVLTCFGGPEAVELRTVPVRPPAADQALVRVLAAALNNTDIWTRDGVYGMREDDPGARGAWLGHLEFPRIQGADLCGEVVAVGSQAFSEWVGSRVLVDPAVYSTDRPDDLVGLMGSEFDGGFAEYTLVPISRLHDVTGSPLTAAELAALPVAYGTAAAMLSRGRVRAGERVVVTGASGGVGSALIELAKDLGAEVIAVTSRAKVDQVCAAGADATVDRTVDGLTGKVLKAAHGPVDAVLDVVGGSAHTELLSTIRPGGRCIVGGAVGGYAPVVDLRRIYLFNISVIGSSMANAEQFALVSEAASRGALHPRVSAAYPLERFHEAQAAFERHELVGKVVVEPAEVDDLGLSSL